MIKITSKWSGNTTTWSDGDVLNSADLNDTFAGSQIAPPVGTVMAWLKSFTGVPQTLPAGWMELDGTTISDSDSPMDGETVPDMAGDARVLLGAATSGTAGTDTHTHTVANHTHLQENSGQNSATGGATPATGAPTATLATYTVVWIMRFK